MSGIAGSMGAQAGARDHLPVECLCHADAQPLARGIRGTVCICLHSHSMVVSQRLARCLQVVAVLFLALMIIIQLNIFATRTPSLWWRFTESTAPRPSVYLMLPVGGVLLAATFVAVYWPEEVQPDGGRGVLIGAGECRLAIAGVSSACDIQAARGSIYAV